MGSFASRIGGWDSTLILGTVEIIACLGRLAQGSREEPDKIHSEWFSFLNSQLLSGPEGS